MRLHTANVSQKNVTAKKKKHSVTSNLGDKYGVYILACVQPEYSSGNSVCENSRDSLSNPSELLTISHLIG